MNAKQKLHQLHLHEWTSRFASQKASGLTVRQWCEQNNYSIHTYNYWKHTLREELADQVLPDIVPLSVPNIAVSSTAPSTSLITNPDESTLTNCANRAIRLTTIAATLTINDVTIQVDSNISEDFLRTIIKAVRYA